MNKKSLAYLLAVVAPLLIFAMPDARERVITAAMLEAMSRVPDSAFTDVKVEDLLRDEVYMKLSHDGWTSDEVRTIMDSYLLHHRKRVRGSNEYAAYAKQWLPQVGYAPGGDSLYQLVDTTYNERLLRATRTAVGAAYDEVYLSEPYSVEPRLRGERQPGVFRPLKHSPSSGRILWIAVHPDNPDRIMCVPDGAGIFRTDDLGRHWECITDRIPRRDHRNAAVHSAIPVDPDDWDHIYAFMNNPYPVYETTDGGQTWRQVVGATHKGFKRGYCFRDAEGNLKFIGAVQKSGSSYWASELWISEDTCKTWTQVALPDSLKDAHPSASGVRGAWFQQVEFDPSDRNRIYLPTSRSIFYFDDGARSTGSGTAKSYTLKKMTFKVWNADRTVLRSEGCNFPFEGTSQGFLNIDPNHPERLWFAVGNRTDNTTAIYFSDDRGANWITLLEPSAGIGSGHAFGNESPWGWLGGFGVNYADSAWVYGCSMSSAISSDGGRTFTEYGWGNRLKALHDDGAYYYASNSRHNADNHCIISHKSGRVYRGSDGGMLIKDKSINDHQWTNIGSDMGQMLYYGVQTNEFGDHVVLGNTQDIDIQTWRYGRWGNWRGYEGSFSCLDPFANIAYYPGGGDGLENAYTSSWSNTYTWADVVTGAWYMRQADLGSDLAKTLMRVENGREAISVQANLGVKVNGVALARDRGVCTLFALGADGAVYRSRDNGTTFEKLFQRSAITAIAADPNNSDLLYAGESGAVYRYDLSDNLAHVGTPAKVGTAGLPAGLACFQLHFHEGSGDLYFVGSSQGIFLKERDSDTWVYWMCGFNTTSYNRTQINYTTQEMYISSYGRGVWAADLQNPADRFFADGFELAEKSHVAGRRTIGISTDWTIPLYYYYSWSVNGRERSNPYQQLTDSLRPGDEVQLTLTLRESPDVQTKSKVYIVGQSASRPLEATRAGALRSSGEGKIDLGWTDHFFDDFTIDFWAKASSDGVLLCNSQKDLYRDAKGWYLALSSGTLTFGYAPHNLFTQPTYEAGYTQQTTLSGGTFSYDVWHHIALTHERDGYVALYVDGELKERAARILPEHTLNSSLNLTLFGDALDRQLLSGSIDELKIWQRALTVDEVRNSMYALNANGLRGLAYYNPFDGESLDACAETFSGMKPQFRGRGAMERVAMPVLIAADTAMTASPGRSLRYFAGTRRPLALRAWRDSIAVPVSAYCYRSSVLAEGQSNLDTAYYAPLDYGYQVNPFSEASLGADSVVLGIDASRLPADGTYRLLAADLSAESKYWTQLCTLTPCDSLGELLTPALSLGALRGKALLPVRMKPAIELVVPQADAAGTVALYRGGVAEWSYRASLVANLEEPFTAYAVQSSSPLLTPSAVSFMRGEGSGSIRVDSRHAGAFADVTPVTLSGHDSRMMPVALSIVNRIAPAEAGASAHISKGGIVVGSGSDFAALASSNTLTMMAWVRIDGADALSGTKPLLMFRGPKTTAIHLSNGNLRCHWNEESWSWSAATPFTLTADHLGRWVHVALVARPDGLDYYLNGQRYTLKRTLNPTAVTTALMLGQNYAGNTWFSGAFDHVALWSRSLTQAEVLRYMHEAVPLDDEALVSYLNMDYVDPATGRVRDLCRDLKSVAYGTVTTGHRSPAPFNPAARYASTDVDSPVRLDGQELAWQLTCYDAYPYNWQDSARANLRPLRRGYQALTFDASTTFSASTELTLTLTDAAIAPGDTLLLGVRRLGSEAPFEGYLPAAEVEEGMARFRFAASELSSEGMEWMLLSGATSSRPAVSGAVALLTDYTSATVSGTDVVLGDTDAELTFSVRLTGADAEAPLTLHIAEGSSFASLDSDVVDPASGESRHTVRIDRSKLDRRAWNVLRLALVGTDRKTEAAYRIALSPKVQLTLKNGTDAHRILANAPLLTLDVEAEPVQGVFDGDVLISSTADYPSALAIGGSTLLSNGDVARPLSFARSDAGAGHEGWNLVGNPYLANVNLTKHQNVGFEEGEVAKYVYSYNPALQNYEAYDMTEYDAAHRVRPFSAFFVQATAPDATLTVRPAAKDTKVNRRNLDYFTAAQTVALRLTLSSGTSLCDRTELKLQPDASAEAIVGEDAAKMRSLASAANQLFSLSGASELAINCLPDADADVPLSLAVGTPGTLRLGADRIRGFAPGELTIVDNLTGREWTPGEDSAYEFTAERSGEQSHRFTLRIRRAPTALAPVRADYQVGVSDGIVSIRDLADRSIVDIFDVQGRRACSEVVRTGTFSVRLAPGVYVVRIMDGAREYTTKILVR